MRVYEYAKQHNVTSKQVIEQLKKHNIELSNHMAVLDQKALDLLAGKSAQKSSATKTPAKKTVQVTVESKQNQAQNNTSATPSKAPAQAADPQKTAAKKGKGGSKKGSGQNTAPARDLFRQSRETVVTPSTVDMVEVTPDMPMGQFASLIKKNPSEPIFVLLKRGVARNVNNTLSLDEMRLLGEVFEVEIFEQGAPQEEKITLVKEGAEQRLPVVVVMGHVDHGKTTLLDYLRKTNVADREKGGITQHLGAYEVQAGKKQKVIFLDTPGHEAFSYMRSRGARITDIAIIIVAANDGVKPQTVEAIELAKKAGVPIVVALNKVDKIESDSQLDTIRTQLTQHDLTPEEWGGDTVCVPLSAKTGKGVDTLLEMLALHAEMLDLKSSFDAPARAFVLETKQVKGQGWAATVICREGTLRRGDYFVSGGATGKVRLLIDSFGKQVKEVPPSVPVQVVGFDTVAGLGDHLDVVTQTEYAKAKSAKDVRPTQAAVQAIEDDTPTIRLLCKADMQGSAQAVADAIEKMSRNKKNKSVRIELLSCDVGPIGESDIIRAADTGAHLFGLHVKAERNAQQLAKVKNVEIVLHSIIYHMLEQIEELIDVERRKIVHLVPAGTAEVLKVFPIKGRKVIAGCMIHEGIVRPGDKVVCVRKKEEIGSGIITSLQRDRKEAKEVHEGNDCGFLTDSFHDWQPGDKVQILTHQHEEV